MSSGFLKIKGILHPETSSPSDLSYDWASLSKSQIGEKEQIIIVIL